MANRLPDGTTICTTTFTGSGRNRKTHRTFHPQVSALEKVQIATPSGTIAWPTENLDRRPTESFEQALQMGRSYMVGTDVPLNDYLKSHGSYIPKGHWLQYAVEWAIQNPESCLRVDSARLMYVVHMRGDYVEIGLPHHDHGGEKHWVVHPSKPRRRILVNVD